MLVLVVTGVSTFILWHFEYLGLNIYGLCETTFLRKQYPSIGLPIYYFCKNLVFLGVGIFTIRYFKKHYPDSAGFRSRRKFETQSLILFVVGYFIFWISEDIIEALLFANCNQDSPQESYNPLAIIYNILTVIQCMFIFLVIFRDSKNRRGFRKFFSRICAKKGDEEEFSKSPSFRTANSSFSSSNEPG